MKRRAAEGVEAGAARLWPEAPCGAAGRVSRRRQTHTRPGTGPLLRLPRQQEKLFPSGTEIAVAGRGPADPATLEEAPKRPSLNLAAQAGLPKPGLT